MVTSTIRCRAILRETYLLGTPFEDLAHDWVCPECGVGKDMFEKIE